MRVEMGIVDLQVYTKIVEYVVENLPQLNLDEKVNFSRTKQNPSTESQFPYIYFERVTGIEKGMNLECDRIEGGLFTYQITVTSNVSKSEADMISNALSMAFKSIGFHATSLPLDNEVDNLHVHLARWQRTLCEGEYI